MVSNKLTLCGLAVISALAVQTVSAAGIDATNQDVTTPNGFIDNSSGGIGINVNNGHSVTVEASDITVKGSTSAIQLLGKSQGTIGTEHSSVVNISAQTQDHTMTFGVLVSDLSQAAISGKTISISSESADGDARGVHIQHGSSNGASELTIGSASTETVTITAKGSNASYGLLNIKSTMNITADEVKIESSGLGLHVGNNTEDSTPPTDWRASTTISAKKTTITADSVGIAAFSNGLVDISGDLMVKAKNVIDTRGYSTININTAGTSTVVLDGNIAYETPGSRNNSGNVIDSNLNLRLTTADSSWKGNTTISYPSYNADKPEYTSISNMSIELANGAQWTPTRFSNNESEITDSDGTTYTQYEKYTGISNLELNGGIINVNQDLIGSDAATVTIDNLKGTGGTINVEVAKNDQCYRKAQVLVKAIDQTVSSEPMTITQTYSGIDSDTASASDFDQLNALQLSEGTAAINQKQIISEGDINGEIIRETDTAGTTKDTVKANTKQDAYQTLTAMNVLAWRHEMNDLTKRMGELRDSPAGIGSWARLYGSEQEYGDQNLNTRSTSVQVGTDFPVGENWKVGAALTYTNGDTSYEVGEADSDSYSGAIYGTWLSESGQFVDLIAKYTRMKSDFSLNGFNGSQDNDALSVSAEYGWHLKLNDLLFVEPQAELTYGRVFGDTFDAEANNAMTIEQDDFDSLIGRVGVRTGFYFPNNKGTVYLRVSGAYDFQGEYEYTARNAQTKRSFKDDLGGAWVEYAVGANFNLTDNAYTYVDLERTSGGEVTENWRWNVGFRYVW